MVAQQPIAIEERLTLITNQGVLDLTGATPDYMTQVMEGLFLPRTHEFAATHNRLPHIEDIDREIMYMRNGTARLIIDEPAEHTWAQGFTLNDEKAARTMDRAWRALRQSLPIADRWNRLYGMGFLVLGFNDGKPLSAPLSGNATTLVWAHAFNRSHIDRVVYDKDKLSKTFGQPIAYILRTGRPGERGATATVQVHLDRIIPLIERPQVHPIQGGSWLDPAWNDLEDAASVFWASAQAFYANASPKLILKTMKPLTSEQESSFDSQFRETRTGGRDVMKMLQSMSLEPVVGARDIAAPLERIVSCATALSHATGIPFSRFYTRDLTSKEALAGAAREWFEFLSIRQRGFGTVVVEALLDRFWKAGLITEEQALAKVMWNPPMVLTREDLSRIVRNEAIGWASAGKTGFVPQDLVPYFVPAPAGFVVDAGQEEAQGDADSEEEERTSTKGLSRGE